MAGTPWKKEELELLKRVGLAAKTESDWKRLRNKYFPTRTVNAVRIRFGVRLPESPYPTYTDPLVMQGDALVLNDLEAPFHDVDFVGNCLALAGAWGIRKLFLGGDFIHNDALSNFEPAFVDSDDKIPVELVETILTELPAKVRDVVSKVMEPHVGREAEPSHSEEMKQAGKLLRALDYQFDEVFCILGNHEGRLLRMLHSALDPNHILREVGIMDNPKWTIRPYYFGIVVSGGQEFRVTHPKNSAKASAWKLAAKYQQHVLMAHNHHLVMQFDPSGKFYAIETGAAVDETRLPYAAQRDNATHAHKLGAVILRNGHPWLLHEESPWDVLMGMP